MVTEFPSHIIVMIITAMIGTAIAIWLILSETLTQLSLSPHVKRGWRWGVAIGLAVWFTIRFALALNPPNGAVIGTPLILTFLGLGVLAGLLPLFLSPVFRQIIRAVPETWIVGIHAIRIFGFAFLALADMRLLPNEFALPAGYGDVAVGLLALGVIYLLVKQSPYARGLAVVWNVLGLIDLVVALVTGGTYIAGFVPQLVASGISPLYLNYVLIIPTFGVPLFILLHVYSLIQLASSRIQTITRVGDKLTQSSVVPSEQRSSYS
jgi:hypothetical protein